MDNKCISESIILGFSLLLGLFLLGFFIFKGIKTFSEKDRVVTVKGLAESTKNARIAGEQFANDSQSKLGKIKTASQGRITIAGKNYSDEEAGETPKELYIQKARVVSTTDNY